MSIKRYTCYLHRCIRSKISRYSLDRRRVEFGAIVTPTINRWVSNNYITRYHREFELVGQLQLKFELQFEAVRTSSQLGGWALRTPGWAEWERSAAKDRGTCCQYVAVCPVPNSPLIHNPFQTFRIKCERYIFLKKCVRSSLLLILFQHVYVLRLYYTRVTWKLFFIFCYIDEFSFS